MTGADAGRLAERAIAALARPGAWLAEVGPGRYAVRVGKDSRRRPVLVIGDAVFAQVAREPGLKTREAGGWRLRAVPAARRATSGPAVILGVREVAEPDGRLARRTANLGESPIAWLARRKDARGDPWLTPAEAAAGERLREDFIRSGLVGRLTMAWDAGPRSGGGRGPGLDPVEQGLDAKRRVRAALAAAGPEHRPMLERICLLGSALEAAERDLGIPRRSGKTVLKRALERLARHYRIG